MFSVYSFPTDFLQSIQVINKLSSLGGNSIYNYQWFN